MPLRATVRHIALSCALAMAVLGTAGTAQARIFFYGGPAVVAPYYPPYYGPYPYARPYYYPPPAYYYPPPPAYYAPPAPSPAPVFSKTCLAENRLVCTLGTPGPVNSDCSCPSGGRRLNGHIVS
jgi:hypothetical protein